MSILTSKAASTKKLIYISFYLFFIVPLLSQLISSLFSYIFDLLIIAMIFTAYIEYKSKWGFYKFLWPILLYLLIIVFSSVLNGVSIPLFIWAFRNAFRGYILFYISYLTLDISDITYLKNKLYQIAIINFIVCIIEVILGYNWDFLGGLFGIEKGGNGYLTLFLAITCGLALNDFLNNKIGLLKLVFILTSSFIESAIGEMKFCLLFIIVISFISLLLNGGFKKVKNLVIFLTLAIIACIGLMLLSALYDDSNMLSLDYFLHYFDTAERGYNSIGDVNRTTFISVINDFFNFNILESLLGIGFGAGEVSNFSVFQSSIGEAYADLLHYNWFQSSFTYLETGILGLISVVLFFVNIFLICFIRRRINNYFRDGVIIAFIGIVMIFYNAALRDSFGLFYYIFLAFPLIIKKEGTRKENIKVLNSYRPIIEHN